MILFTDKRRISSMSVLFTEHHVIYNVRLQEINNFIGIIYCTKNLNHILINILRLIYNVSSSNLFISYCKYLFIY
jgi:hypothetical protein